MPWRWGLISYNPTVRRGIDNMSFANVVAQEIDEFDPDAVFIDGGRGEGVIDRLRQLGHDVIQVDFGSTQTINEGYHNRRSEMWDRMKEWIDEGGMLPPDKDLLLDLTKPTFQFTPTDNFKLESKEEIKKRSKNSPDLGDALALTFAAPVGRRVMPHLPGGNPSGHNGDWEPDF